jgi:phosphohistidine phosphatase
MMIRTNARLANGTNGYSSARHSADAAASGRIEIGMPGTKRLFVLRHAKSSWDNPGLEDHERPLAPRGQRACVVMAEHIRATGIAPDLVLCSSARRTRETLERVDPPGERVIEPALYSASTDQVIARLRQVPDDVGSVMLVGHNPASQVLVLRLSHRDRGAAASPERAAVERKFPTGALATLTFDGSWSDLAPGGALLTEFLTPRELSEAERAGSGARARRA